MNLSVEASSAAAWQAGQANVWVDLNPLLDRLFLPFERLLTATATASDARQILDVGCGAGATTLSIANALGSGGHCTGFDVSPTLIDLARERARDTGVANARFIVGDVQRQPLDHATCDAIVSRFGIMFFDDPVAAFANLRRATRPGGQLTAIVWRDRTANPFMTEGERLLARFVPGTDHADRHAPGQFAFADPDHVSRILTGSGWARIAIDPLDMACTLPRDDLALYVRRMGKLGVTLPTLDGNTRDALLAGIDAAFEPYVDGDVARFTSACWLVQATPSPKR